MIADITDAQVREVTGLQPQREVTRSPRRDQIALAEPVMLAQSPSGARQTIIIPRHGCILDPSA